MTNKYSKLVSIHSQAENDFVSMMATEVDSFCLYTIQFNLIYKFHLRLK